MRIRTRPERLTPSGNGLKETAEVGTVIVTDGRQLHAGWGLTILSAQIINEYRNSRSSLSARAKVVCTPLCYQGEDGNCYATGECKLDPFGGIAKDQYSGGTSVAAVNYEIQVNGPTVRFDLMGEAFFTQAEEVVGIGLPLPYGGGVEIPVTLVNEIKAGEIHDQIDATYQCVCDGSHQND